MRCGAISHGSMTLLQPAGADTLLGPEMRSTGEVMGIDTDFSKAYAKAALAAGQKLPASGTVFISVADKQKEPIAPIAKQLQVSYPEAKSLRQQSACNLPRRALLYLCTCTWSRPLQQAYSDSGNNDLVPR